jgi:KDO2-lipid IV(A) lauroyltransferase
MKATGYYIFYIINYLITLLPLRVLYVFSDIFYVLIYHLIRYRRNIVATNLRNAFPEKSDPERKMIERRFYRYLADLIVETLKVTHMSPKEISTRFTVRDMTLINRFYDEGRDIVAVCGHYNNWEWLSSIPLQTSYKSLTIYKPLKNEYFDSFIFGLRTKYGVHASAMENIFRDLLNFRKNNVRTVTAFIADQTPPRDNNPYWATFLNQDTCFYRGPEKIAVKFDMPVFFAHITREKRGYYKLEMKLITDHPKDEAPDYITSRHASMLEEVIREKPEYWLWSHRRWKYKRPV